MKSSAVQRVSEVGLLMALVVKRQLVMGAVVLETHVLTEILSSSVARSGGPWPFRNSKHFTNFELLSPQLEQLHSLSTKVFSEEEGQRGSRWKTHLSILK